MRQAPALRSPFGHDLRSVRAAARELESADPRPAKSLHHGVEKVERDRDPDGRGADRSNRGARIRTGGLPAPNGMRYQAAPRPETLILGPFAADGVHPRVDACAEVGV